MSNKVYEIVTERILEKMKLEGLAPWQKPWHCDNWPRNGATKRPYHGINVYLLSGHASPYWFTFNQVNALGGRIKAGEKASIAVFWKLLPGKREKSDGTIEDVKIPLLRYYNVFNETQTEGLPDKSKWAEAARVVNDIGSEDAAEAICKAYLEREGIAVKADGKAYYAPFADFIGMPPKATFNTVSGYYNTLFHEMGHSTGHKKRLDRFAANDNETGGYRDSYSAEELVAEFTAAFLCAEAGIAPEVQLDQQAAYIANWHKALNDNPRWLVYGASRAQAAAGYVLGRKAGEESEGEATAEPQAVNG